MIFPSEIKFIVKERSQPKGAKPKMRTRKLRRGVNLQGALKQKWHATTGVKQVPDVPALF